MSNLEILKKMAFNGLLARVNLQHLEQNGIPSGIAVDETLSKTLDSVDFSPRIKHDAQRMSELYTVFFCLENSAREFIQERLLARRGVTWWNACVPQKVKDASQKLMDKESKNKYHAQRGTELINYTLFGNLAQIIIANWEDFSDVIPDQPWVTSRFNDLEISRNIIMHTGVLPEIEIERTESIIRDWLRQVGA